MDAVTAPPDGTGVTDVEAVGRHVEVLLDEVAAADPAARDAAERLVAELLGLYGEALARLVDTLAVSAPDRLAALAAEPLLDGLLALHDLHPLDRRTRVEAAVHAVRRDLGAAVDGLLLVTVDDDRVVLRLEGDGNGGGCGHDAGGIAATVAEAVRAAVPDVADVLVETPPPAPRLIPASTLRLRSSAGNATGDPA